MKPILGKLNSILGIVLSSLLLFGTTPGEVIADQGSSEARNYVNLATDNQSCDLFNLHAPIDLESLKEPPRLGNTFNIVEVKSDKIFLQGDIVNLGDSNDVTILIEYGKTLAFGEYSQSITMNNNGPFEATVNDLEAETEYYYRVIAIGDGGTSTSETRSFTTPVKEKEREITLDTQHISQISPVEQIPTESIVQKSVTRELPLDRGTDRLPESLLSEDLYLQENGGSLPFAATVNFTDGINPTKRVSTQVNPDQEIELKSTDNKISVKIPKNVSNDAIEIELIQRTPFISTGMRNVTIFELNAFSLDSKEKINKFNNEIEITIHHDPAELIGINTNSLQLYYLDESKRLWLPIKSTYDKKNMVLTACTNHFTVFGEQGQTSVVGPGLVLAANVNLNSGSSTFSYPIELPPGPGGFKPSVHLSYDSNSVNEMKNKQSVGSWVGTGWSCNLGRIVKYHYFCSFGENYILELNGTAYELASSDGINYRTNPDHFYKITRSEDEWDMYDTEGNHYKFGDSSSSIQYEKGESYRWDLSLIEDTNGNQATISYQQDIRGTAPDDWVRSAYPEYLKYNDNSIEVHFILSEFTGYTQDPDPASSGGYLRADNPMYYYNPNTTTNTSTPKIMENRELKSIEIKVDDELIRRYDFDYTTTARVFEEEHYSGIYYAGKHILDSITQVGTDNGTLPSIEFSYDDKQIYRYTDEGDYGGNPGNPASLYWPFLTQIESGYGATITYTYAQIPDTLAENIWTREVVTSKSIDSGVGPSENYTFEYVTGEDTDPQYWGTSWVQKYRGFGQVTVTDSEANYVVHHFYTTGVFEDQNSEKLTGLEYRTEWFDSGDEKKQEKNYDWTWYDSSNKYDLTNVWVKLDEDGNGRWCWSFQADSQGNIYATSFVDDKVFKYDPYGNILLSWGGPGDEEGKFDFPSGIAVDNNGNIYVTDCDNSRVQKFDSSGSFICEWGEYGLLNGDFRSPEAIAVDEDDYVYVVDKHNNRIQKFSSNGTFLDKWGSYGSGNGQFINPNGIAIDSNGDLYITDYGNARVQKFDSDGNYISQFGEGLEAVIGIEIDYQDQIYVVDVGSIRVFSDNGTYQYALEDFVYYSGDVALTPTCIYTGAMFLDPVLIVPRWWDVIIEKKKNWAVQLNQVDTVTGDKTVRTRYEYDDYGNIVVEYLDGDLDTNDDDATVHRSFYPNTSANILNRPARERVYSGTQATDNGGANLTKETCYYYDDGEDQYHDDTNWEIPPIKGNLTRLEQQVNPEDDIDTYFVYDSFGNKISEEDPEGNITEWTYETTFHTYPDSKIYPVSGLSENYTYEAGTNNLLSITDVNDGTTYYYYDEFKRLTKVVKPQTAQQSDSEESPSIEYQYIAWGTLGDQNITTIVKIDSSNSTWQSEYFDGLGRTIQLHSQGENDYIIVSGTTAYNNRGQLVKTYISQNLDEQTVNGYVTPGGAWKHNAYEYDALGRIIEQTNVDGTTVNNDYSTTWQTTATNERGYTKDFTYDAYGRLVKVNENVNDGAFLEKWGVLGQTDGQFYLAKGVSIDNEGNIYVIDSYNHQIEKYDSSGHFLFKWGSYGSGDGEFNVPWDLAVDSNGYVYVTDYYNYRVQKFDSNGTFIFEWGGKGTGNGQFTEPRGIAINSNDTIYVTDDNRVQAFTVNGTYVTKWGSYGTGNGQFKDAFGIAVGWVDAIFVVDAGNNRVQKFDYYGGYISQFGTYGTGNGQFRGPTDVGIDGDHFIYVTDKNNNRVQKFSSSGVYVSKWGSYGTGSGYFNSVSGIGVTTDGYVYVSDEYNYRIQKFNSNGSYQKKWGRMGNDDCEFYGIYGLDSDDYGNIYVADTYNHRIQKIDGDGNLLFTWGSAGSDPGQFVYPMDVAIDSAGDVYVVDYFNNCVQKFNSDGDYITRWGQSGSDNGSFYQPWGICVDTNDYVYVADTSNFRIQKFSTNGDYITKWGSQGSGDGQFEGPIGIAADSQNNIYIGDESDYVKKFTSEGSFICKWGGTGSDYGEFAQPYSLEVDENDDVYIADGDNARIQKFDSNGEFLAKWGSSGSNGGQFDFPMGITAFEDSIYVGDYSDIQKFQFISKTTTIYEYDVLGNLIRVIDNNGNSTNMTYDWLSRKTAMSDPDMGDWTYTYDGNGNVETQTDAKGQTITMLYDELNRLTNKNYPQGSEIDDVVYSYDDITDNNKGKGKRTGMIDDIFSTSYKYDSRGRLIEETRHYFVDYTTSFTYDGVDRLANITYPTGEIVTYGYNLRGLPFSVSGTSVGSVVSSTYYNELGQVTEINLGNGLRTTFDYWGIDHETDSYGRIWEIKTLPQVGGTAIQDITHTWDETGNLVQRVDILASETENFEYDCLDRLTSVSGAYEKTYTYDGINNITSMDDDFYIYNDKPHAVYRVDSSYYDYDENGNRLTVNNDIYLWDVENRLRTKSSTTFYYDGDGKRTAYVPGFPTLYINKYYETRLTEDTTYYYLGERLIAQRNGSTVSYIHQDHLLSTSVISDSGGSSTGSIKYFPFGETRNSQGSIPTFKKFTGQRLDSTGLYYYGARYYDASIGKFISPDTIIPQATNPMNLNRYSYCLNNPLRFMDPSGHEVYVNGIDVSGVYSAMDMAFLLGVQLLTPAISEVIVSNDFQAYNEFKNENGQIATQLEQSALEYEAHSESANADDLYITNSQRIQDNFTMLMPGGTGQVNYEVNTTWHQGSATISVSTSTTVTFPETSHGFSSAKLYGTTTYLPLKQPEYPVLVSLNTDVRNGSIQISNGFSDSKIQLDLTVSVNTNSSDPSDFSYHHIVTPSSWHIVLWEGRQ